MSRFYEIILSHFVLESAGGVLLAVGSRLVVRRRGCIPGAVFKSCFLEDLPGIVRLFVLVSV